MKKLCLTIIAGSLIFGMVSCGKKEKSMGFDMKNLDTTANPAQDFYQYACGGWMKNNPIPDQYSRYGNFDKLTADNQEQVRSLIEELSQQTHQPGSVAQKIGDLYKIGMDTARIESEGIAPIESDLQMIKELTDKPSAISQIAHLHREVITPFFVFFVGADEKNSSMNILTLYQGGLGMPDRGYYLENDETSTNIRNAYISHIEKMLILAGFTAEDAKKSTASVMTIETALAKASSSRQELRIPENNYNKLSVEELQKWTPSINWKEYFNVMGIGNVTELVVGQENFFKELNKIITSSSLEDLQAYFAWNVIRTASSYLTDAMVKQNFEFYGKTLTGAKEMQPRWKRAVNMVNGTIGEGVGEMYVAKYFPEESKQRMLTLITNLQEALKDRILQLDWMTDVTKEKAIEKLATFHVKVGYPDKWRDYSTLQVNPEESYWTNIKYSNAFDMEDMISKIGKPVDKDEWLMNAQMVNAYYNPTTNEICFPAGILQPPFFYAQGDDAINYGAIGVVIGHEMTHGFDDQGRMYDKDGNLKDWWTAEDTEKFNARAERLVTYFNQQFVLDTVPANGQFTLGENIADQGGLILAYAALQKALKDKNVKAIDGFTPEQRFYLAYANLWAGNIRSEEILRLTKIDEHSLGRLRVNATLPHIKEFLQAFDIKEGDPMYLPETERALVW